MAQFIVRFSVDLTALDQVFSMNIPLSATDVALRVLCRYAANQTPPPPTILLVVTMPLPDPTPADITTRNFNIQGVDTPLPDDFVKYIGQVPFGPDKQLVNIIERAAVTHHAQES